MNEWCKAQQISSVPHCRVLPSGEFNDMIPQTVYSEFHNGSCNCSRLQSAANSNTLARLQTNKVTNIKQDAGDQRQYLTGYHEKEEDFT